MIKQSSKTKIQVAIDSARPKTAKPTRFKKTLPKDGSIERIASATVKLPVRIPNDEGLSNYNFYSEAFDPDLRTRNQSIDLLKAKHSARPQTGRSIQTRHSSANRLNINRSDLALRTLGEGLGSTRDPYLISTSGHNCTIQT